MNKISKSTGVLLTGIICLSLSVVGVASGAEPGDASDPLVSKSYVDSKISETLSGLSSSNLSEDEIVNEVLSKVNSASAAQYVPVSASAGSIVIGGEGTEIILRSGAGIGYVIGSDGMVDATTGADVKNGTGIEKNHMLIVPRNDGRGVKVTSDAWFIIKGTYNILN
ncbi:MAG: hypothetical protein VB120_06675 [Lachnospiraceae bacterium]|nr:hypothetical protein [Lachnospiraceae bacterium]